MKKIWNQLGHSLFTEDESSRKTKHILKTVFFFYILVLLKVIVFKYPLARLEAIAASWTKEVVWEGLGTANFTLFKTIRMYIRYWGKLNALKSFRQRACFCAAWLLTAVSAKGEPTILDSVSGRVRACLLYRAVSAFYGIRRI